MTTSLPLAESLPHTDGRPYHILRGKTADPRWARPALLILLAGTAAVYLVDLGASGNANSFYAAAVQAGTKSWKAFLFGSLDSSNFITVDKPPASLWVMEISGRIFGFSSWSMLVPQALEGVGSVALLYAMVRRWFGIGAGLLAGLGLAITPVAVVMFRFNNPDALLVLLLIAAAYCVVRAVERANTWWLVLAGSAVGCAFLTKMLQAFLVVPALGLVYLVAAPTPLRRRILQLLAGGAAVVASAGWWVAIVELVPARDRPYVGGSTGNSILQLVWGYNGLGRLTGNENGGGGGAQRFGEVTRSAGLGGGAAPGGRGGRAPGGGFGGPGGGAFGGSTGLTRMFGDTFGGEVSWLLPAALLALVAGLWLTRRAPRTDKTRAALLLWGGWLLVTALVFSYMQGIVHPYYTVALAPAIAALVAIMANLLWQHRDRWFSRVVLALMVAGSGIWGYVLLDRTPDWHPWLRVAIVIVAGVAAVALLIPSVAAKRAAAAIAVVALVGGFGATGAYAAATAAVPHTGSIPTSGPSSASDFGGGFGAVRDFPRNAEQPGTVERAGNGAQSGNAARSGGTRQRRQGGPGAEQANSAVTALLRASTTKWAAATTGSQSAAPLELASGKAVMAIGGFSGSDPAPTLAQFKAYVAAGEVRYFIAGGGFGGGQSAVVRAGGGQNGGDQNGSGPSSGGQNGGGPGSGGAAGGGPGRANSGISSWVESHFTAKTVGGETVYDLSAAKS